MSVSPEASSSGCGESENTPARQQIVLISGPSGSGKSTIVNRLVNESPVKLIKMISATTRPRREKEVEGEDYYFLTADEFTARRDRDEFVEFEEVFSSGFWYGTLKSELERARQLGGWAFLEIDVNGALRVMEQYPSAVSIFLKTPDEKVFEQRLRNRGTESEEVIQRRLETARSELKFADRYRHQVVNDNLDRAVAEIIEILTASEAEEHD
ncbi:MAG: guanylate kinase [Planctomycetota bacterium]|jgi:guanylate kinase